MGSKLIKVLISINFVFYGTKGIEVCPKICICDVFEGYYRADCSDQRLITPHVNIAKSVEILNLSGNDIATIDDDSFKELHDLINLSLARNSISSIFLFAFAPLKKLTFLDLSDNRLESFSPDLFEYNEKITSLDISKNKFMFLQDEPLIRSKSLEFLSLQNSHISHVFPSFFSLTPNILNLDLSNNLLITISKEVFRNMTILHSLNLEYNRFSCEQELEKTLHYLKKQKVVVKIDRCSPKSKKPMFEKIIMIPTVTEVPQEDIEIELVWGKKLETIRANRSSNKITRYYENIIEDEYIQKCKKSNAEDTDMCECYQNFINLFELKNQTNHNLKAHMEMRLLIVFNVGVLIGILFGCTVLYCAHDIYKKCKKIKRKTIEIQRRRDERTHQVQEIRVAEHSTRNSPISALRNNPGNNQNFSENLELRNVQRACSPHAVQRHHFIEVSEPSYRPSSTAQLINKLFRNREPRINSHSEIRPSRVRPIAPQEDPQPSTSSFITDTQDHVDSFTYLNIENAENNELENQREEIDIQSNRCSTPPPPYRSIFDSENT